MGGQNPAGCSENDLALLASQQITYMISTFYIPIFISGKESLSK